MEHDKAAGKAGESKRKNLREEPRATIRQPSDSLAAEVERRMRARPYRYGDYLHLKDAVAVAVEMIEEERADAQQYARLSKMALDGLTARAEAAEKKLAERGHVAGCDCHAEYDEPYGMRSKCAGSYVGHADHPYRDPRCSPEPEGGGE